MQGEFRSGFFRFVCISIVALVCGCFALAQAPPDEAHAVAISPTSVLIEFQACQTAPNENCYLDFSIYRDPPGFTQKPVWADSVDPNSYSHTEYDPTAKPGQTYSFMVCAGGFANSDQSNCIKTNSVKTPTSTGTPPSSKPSPTPTPVPNNGLSIYKPPQNFQVTALPSSMYLRWTNPAQKAVPSNVVLLRSMGGATVAQIIQRLNGQPTSFTDAGPLPPHTSYFYFACEGDPNPGVDNNCAKNSGAAVTWGADPVLTAVRVNPTTVKLNVVVDNIYDVASILVTRQGSDDPCRQGTSLGNGQQGCKTQSIGPNGVAVNTGNTVTVYQGTGMGSNSTSAPWSLIIPDDTVKAGVEYYYLAQVTWTGPVRQDSAVVTVPKEGIGNAPAPIRTITSSGPKPITPPKPAPAMTRAPISARAAARAPAAINPPAGNLDSAINNAKLKPGDAQALYALGQAYCASRLRSPCVSMMYMGLLQAEKAGNAQLASEIRASLAQQGVTVQ